jgi:hypothetical protein
MENEEPINTPETGRDEKGRWLPGFCPNMQGRKRNPLKEYSLKEFNEWTDEQKKAFLEKISPIDRWKMTEGAPQTDITTDGDKIQIPIYGGKSVSKYDSNREDIQTDEKNQSS